MPSTNPPPPPYSFVGPSRQSYLQSGSIGGASSANTHSTSSCGRPRPNQRVYHAPDYAQRPDEHTALLLIPRKPRGVGYATHITIMVVFFIFAVFVLPQVLRPEHSLDEAQKDKERREHQLEHDKWDRELQDHKRKREDWERESREHESDRQEYERERRKWEQERQEHDRKQEEARRRKEQEKWEEEERQRLAIHWDEPVGEPECFSYATREYTSRLWNVPITWDRQKTCEKTEVKIHNVTLKKPDHCEDRGLWGGMYGHWFVKVDEKDCMPYWGSFEDKGCTAQGSGLHRVESRLWNIQKGDWMKMCSTTPADIHDIHFEGPKYCDNKGVWGIYGIWEIEDPNCF